MLERLPINVSSKEIVLHVPPPITYGYHLDLAMSILSRSIILVEWNLHSFFEVRIILLVNNNNLSLILFQ